MLYYSVQMGHKGIINLEVEDDFWNRIDFVIDIKITEYSNPLFHFILS